jgi:hypothetical protein
VLVLRAPEEVFAGLASGPPVWLTVPKANVGIGERNDVIPRCLGFLLLVAMIPDADPQGMTDLDGRRTVAVTDFIAELAQELAVVSPHRIRLSGRAGTGDAERQELQSPSRQHDR